VRHAGLGSLRDTKQLLPLHDAVNEPDDESGQQRGQAVETVARTSTGANQEPRHAAAGGRHAYAHEQLLVVRVVEGLEGVASDE
jgi:hypothetical protein